jgi:hypothetical protein
VTDDERLAYEVRTALRGVLIGMIEEGAPVHAIANAATSRVLGVLAAPRAGSVGDSPERPEMRPAEARNARNSALLTELRGMEVLHGRLACGMLARRLHPDDPLAVAALVKHLQRLRRRDRGRSPEWAEIPG